MRPIFVLALLAGMAMSFAAAWFLTDPSGGPGECRFDGGIRILEMTASECDALHLTSGVEGAVTMVVRGCIDNNQPPDIYPIDLKLNGKLFPLECRRRERVVVMKR